MHLLYGKQDYFLFVFCWITPFYILLQLHYVSVSPLYLSLSPLCVESVAGSNEGPEANDLPELLGPNYPAASLKLLIVPRDPKRKII